MAVLNVIKAFLVACTGAAHAASVHGAPAVRQAGGIGLVPGDLVEVLIDGPPGLDPAEVAARQQALNFILTAAHDLAKTQRNATQAIPQLGALVQAHLDYSAAMSQAQSQPQAQPPSTTAAPAATSTAPPSLLSRRGANADGSVGAAPGDTFNGTTSIAGTGATLFEGLPGGEEAGVAMRQLLAQVHERALDFVANTNEGQALVQTLSDSNADFKTAEAKLSANRSPECMQLMSQGIDQSAQGLSARARTCMCSFGRSYMLCRMMLANDMHMASMNATSSVPEGFDWDDLHGGNPRAVQALHIDKFNTQAMNATSPSLQFARQSGGGRARRAAPKSAFSKFFNPSSGTIGADQCVEWVDPPISLCLREQADLPREDLWEPTKDGKVQITDCSNGIANCQVQVMTVEDAVASQAEKWAGMGAEFTVSLCLGVPGLSDLLAKVGIGLCADLMSIGFFPIQGPTVQFSMGLSLFVVGLHGWMKIKTANSSPLCPQDWNPNWLNSACSDNEGRYYDAFYGMGKKDTFCQMNADSDSNSFIFGFTINVDLLFWSKEWTWAETPAKRDNPKCPNGHQIGPVAQVWEQVQCYDASRDYLNAHKDVKADPKWSADPHGHYLAIGKAKGYVWPGRQCTDEDLGYTYTAQEIYYSNYRDVGMDPAYGPKSAPYTNGWKHYQEVVAEDDRIIAERRIWPGQWSQTDFNEVCEDAILDFYRNNYDAAQDVSIGGYTRLRKYYIDSHVLGTAQQMEWKGDLCLKHIGCQAAQADYLTRYPDVGADPKFAEAPILHYQQVGKAEGRRWKGHLCAQAITPEFWCNQASNTYATIYSDIIDAGFTNSTNTKEGDQSWRHYTTIGKAEGRIWPSNVCYY